MCTYFIDFVFCCCNKPSLQLLHKALIHAAHVQGTSKNVGEAVSAIPMAAPQKQAKKRSLRAVNEHSEPAFNAAMATQVVYRGALHRPVRRMTIRFSGEPA
ncbi:conserved protein of unknown function [Ectopseudomonas oleovorans]|uniref:Uncharacterized protein n=1 Tax=Ectopseudomonas oleovorans TaxID=301 RepID=A0A653AY85_ECTOL|nr:conserved protein of unknown function [Pseudomonas oleovorans]